MKKFFLLLLCLIGASTAKAKTEADTIVHEVLLETSMGPVRVKLFNDTPLHRDNFLKLVKEGFYDGVLFHRVIPDFMVQAGDSASRHAKPDEKIGDSPESYSVPAEIRYPIHYHRSGALAAAREDASINPQLASSASQFYIVTGRIFTEDQLDKTQQRLDEESGGKIKLTPEVRETYRNIGGAPHLDGTYTVFGEVVEGYDVVDRIQWAGRDENDRPFDDVRIVKATVVK